MIFTVLEFLASICLAINSISTHFMGLGISCFFSATSKDTALTLAAQKGWLEAFASGTGV